MEILVMREGKAFLSAITILFIVVLSCPISANVTGPCANCHTMHNSQNGLSVARDGTGVGWDASGRLTGGSIQDTPMKNLLISGCVGCHTSTTGETIITTGSSRIPIVFQHFGISRKTSCRRQFLLHFFGWR